jgi:hypothetical protein
LGPAALYAHEMSTSGANGGMDNVTSSVVHKISHHSTATIEVSQVVHGGPEK